MRLESCRHFDTELFIKNLKIWGKEKKKLEQRLEEICELPSINNESGVRGSSTPDPTSRIALQRIEIEEQIRDIEQCEKIYEDAKSRLTPDELELFQIFFEPKTPIWKAIEEYGAKKYICRGIVYQRRSELVKKLDGIFNGYF